MHAVSSSSELISGWYKYEFGHMATRAWCMQEYLLSPRALIFTPTTIMFRCISATQAVGNSLYYWVSDREPRIPKSLFLPHTATVAPTPEKWRDIHNAWTEVVEDYTRRTASVESDKLVACAAVAEQFHRALGSDYLAGLWRSDTLLVHLLWSVDLKNTDRLRSPHTRPAAYRAPSWSWAAIEGITSHRYPRDLSLGDPQTVALAEVAECSVTLEDPALSFGRVTDGALVLRGTLILCHDTTRLRMSYCHPELLIPLPSFDQARRYHPQHGGIGGFISDEEEEYWTKPARRDSASVTMDCDLDVDSNNFDKPRLERVYLVPLVCQQDKADKGLWRVYGIALAELSPPFNDSGYHPEKTRFRRIGTFRNRDAKYRDQDWDFPLWDPLIRAVKDGKHSWTDIVIV